MPIGNRREGFTFIEVMVSLVVLSAGIVLIYKSFFLCVDYLNNLTCRIYASQLIDERMADISQAFLDAPHDGIDWGASVVRIEVNHRPIDFNFTITVIPLVDVNDVQQVAIALTWFDGRREMHSVRYAYMSP